MGRDPDPETIRTRLSSEHAGVRYWAATAVLAMGNEAGTFESALAKLLDDPVPEVRMPAAEALARQGNRTKKAVSVLSNLLDHDHYWTRVYAGIHLRHLRERARPAVPDMKKALRNSDGNWPYFKWVLQDYIDWTNGENPLLYGFTEP